MRLTEKENETLPIDVSDFDANAVHFNRRLYFTTNPQELFVSGFSLCRLYYRPYYRLWWPVMVLSTLLESSKTWTPPQSWKTSRLSYRAAPSSLDNALHLYSIYSNMTLNQFPLTLTKPLRVASCIFFTNMLWRPDAALHLKPYLCFCTSSDVLLNLM